MAGIAGIVTSTPSNTASALKSIQTPLCFHPGSDVENWNNDVAGFCRVKCGIDNPETQPIFNRQRTKCILMFGECFDYEDQKKELGQRGRIFKHTDNDAEYCLALYDEYGEKAFSQLSGSFVFAIYDLVTRELLLVNDRLASRPIFYVATDHGKFIFSTQASSILREPAISTELDTAAVIEFFCLQRVLGTKTYHEGVRMLPPGSILRYRQGKIDIAPFWHPQYEAIPGSVEEYAEELAVTMKRAMSQVTRGATKVATLLSGGLDSRMLLAAADTDLACFTFGDYDNPEAQTARRIAEAKGFSFQLLQRDPDHYFNMVETAVEIGNGMHPFNHAHPLGFIELIAENFDVVTHGYAPELLFRGTNLPKIQREIFGIKLGKILDPTLSDDNLADRFFRRNYALIGKGTESLFASHLKESVKETLYASANRLISDSKPYCSSVFDRFLWPDIYHYSRYPAGLLELSLRPYMTERSIVFHNEVIDLHLRMPVHLRADNTVWLTALKRLNRNVAQVPDANTGYSPYLPSAIGSSLDSGKKIAQRTPLLWRLSQANKTKHPAPRTPGLSPHSWPRFDWMIRSNAKFRELLTNTIGDPEALPPEIFDRKKVRKILADHLADKGHYRTILFVVLTFGRWHKKHRTS